MSLSRKYGLRPGDWVIVAVVLLLAVASALPFPVALAHDGDEFLF